MRRTRTLLALPALALVAPMLTGCTDQQAEATDAAEAFARGLADANVTTSAGAEAQEQLEAAWAPLGDTRPSVTVEDVAEPDDDTTTADLAWRWELDAGEVGYATTVTLTREGDTWTPSWEPSLLHEELRDGETLDLRTLPAERGEILGAGGAPLVTARPIRTYGLDKSRIEPAQVVPSARAVADFLDVDRADFVERAKGSGPKAFVEAIALRPADARDLPFGFDDIPGAGVVAGERHLAITRDFAAPILGRVGPVTAEIVEESDGRYAAGDEAGLSGLSARYDEQLAGEPGVALVAQAESESGSGSEDRVLEQVEPVDGEPLTLTLSVPQQRRAEAALADLPRSAGISALVAVRPSDGAVLAAADGPHNDGLAASTYSRFAPGSTFKVVTSLGLLRDGLTPPSTVSCPRTTTADGKSFENYDDYPADGYGDISLATALANSCNTAFVGERDRVAGSRLADAAASLGLGIDRDLGAPAYFGQVPPPAGETELAADTIGQGRVLASPLVMATVAASVVRGSTVVPVLVEGVAPEAEGVDPLTRGEARALRSMMRGVVERGSGAVLAGVAEGAKTGTAEFGEPGPGGSLPTHAWMIAFRGDLAVAAFVERGESGSQTAGPILREFLG